MSTLTRSLFALALAPLLLGAALTGSAEAARAHQPITLRTVLQGHTLSATGRNFTPGARVSIALIDTRSWTTLIKGTATAEAATYTCPPGTSVKCGQKDPNAGDLYFETTLHQHPIASALAILYRSGTEVGFGRVRAQ